MSLPIEKLINELNSVNPQDQEKIIDKVLWLKQKIKQEKPDQTDQNVFEEVEKLRERLYKKYGTFPDSTELIREDRNR